MIKLENPFIILKDKLKNVRPALQLALLLLICPIAACTPMGSSVDTRSSGSNVSADQKKVDYSKYVSTTIVSIIPDKDSTGKEIRDFNTLTLSADTSRPVKVNNAARDWFMAILQKNPNSVIRFRWASDDPQNLNTWCLEPQFAVGKLARVVCREYYDN